MSSGILRVVALLVAALATRCAADATCPPDDGMPDVPVDSGEYYSVSEDSASYPPRKISVDAERGIIRVSYYADGKQVIESWIVGSREVRK